MKINMRDNSVSLLFRYTKLLGEKEVERIKKKALMFEKKEILHINATKYGGGVAEILQNMIPLMQELNMNASWKIFTAPDNFFKISKKMHNALQGNMDIHFSDDEISSYILQAKSIYDQTQPKGDFIIIHDPQPCPIIKYADKNHNKWIWRCHIDTSNPNPQAWDLISDYLSLYDALIFTKLEYAKKEIQKPIYQIPPSIDPFSEKNRKLDIDIAKDIVEKFVPLDLPLITQVSRFDPWKDPLGVIDTYRKVSKEHPVRLALIGSLAHDDPEGVKWLEKLKNYADDDPNIYILSNLDGIGDIEVNAFQQISNIVIQKSIKEGFGLTVTEALWKKTPVIGGNVGGIKLQIEDGINGFLINTVDEAVEKILYLLKNPKISKKMGINGHKKVKRDFLLINHLEKYLDLFMDQSQ
ncbi:MAG: glycosyltransferase [Candidatus Thorarchaeota archaeon]